MLLNNPNFLQLLMAIRENKIVLPDIQRDFVWDEEQIFLFCDSFFRGYPFGSFLFWKVIGSEDSDKSLIYRNFILDCTENMSLFLGTDLKPGEEKLLVLDGQQRLQSCYLSFFGTHNGRELYLDIMTGQHDYDKEHDLEFYVRFFRGDEISKFQRLPAGRGRKMVRIKDFMELDHQKMDRYADKKVSELNVGEGLISNDKYEAKYKSKYKIQQVWSALRDPQRAQQFTIDSSVNTPVDATSLTEVAEIFVRVNSGGTRLTRSELIFTLLKSRWREARQEFDRLTDEINSRGEFQTDTDFIIRALMVLSGRSSRLNVERMRDENVMLKFKDIFPRAREALQSSFDFLTSPSGGAIRTYRLLTSGQRADRGYNVLLPIAQYLFLRPSQEIPENQRRRMRRYLYIVILSRYLVVYVESHLDKLSNVIRSSFDNGNHKFPLEEIEQEIKEWAPFTQLSDFFGSHHSLDPILNILHGGSVDFKTLNSRNAPQRDHIFPRSKLEKTGVPDDKIHHFANMRLLGAIANILKSDEDPVSALSDLSVETLAQDYLIPKEYLNYEHYEEFLVKRTRLIHEAVQKWLAD